MKKSDSPYSAALTGGGFLFKETDILLPMLLSKDRKALLKDEAMNNNVLQINSEKSRQRNIVEIERRFDSMPSSFWGDFMAMPENDRIIANFFVILKTYKIAFEFHINVTMQKWKSVDKTLSKQDLMREFNEISAKDEFVDTWSDSTKGKLASAYLTILRKVGMLDEKGNLSPINPTNPEYYLTIGESWFLEACLWAPYQIENAKKAAL